MRHIIEIQNNLQIQG